MQESRRCLHWLFNGYIIKARNQELTDTLDSVAGLLVNNLGLFRTSIEESYQEIKSVSQDKEQGDRMLTIRQEEQEESTYETDPILKSINKSLGDIKYLDRRTSQVIQMYKQELRRLATDVYKWEKKNKDLKVKLKKQEEMDQNVQEPPMKIQDKRLWESLNKKLETLKKNLKLYQDQIKEKDIQISTLKSTDGSGKDHDKQLKQLRRGLTTIRGEKSLMVSQYDGLRKLLSSKEQVLEIQTDEIQKYKIEINHLTESLTQAKSSLNSGLEQAQSLRQKNRELLAQLDNTSYDMNSYIRQCPKQELDKLQRDNKTLGQSLEEARRGISCLTCQLEQLQQTCSRERKRSQQMSHMVAQKNETIVRLKSIQPQEKYQYYVQLVKLLTKKVLDRDQTIQNLKSH